MHRISSWTDLVSAAGGFRYGSLSAGAPPTPIKAEWLNMVQEEIASVVIGAGIALDKTKTDQLKRAIQKMVSDYLPLSGGTLAGLLKATKGVRTAKGLPGGNASEVGYAFDDDGDTGLFATGGTAENGSDVVLLVDRREVARFTGNGRMTFDGGNEPYHTGNKPTMLDVVYPVGSVYLNASVATSPAMLFGFGTWLALAPGRMLIGAGTGTDARGDVRAFSVGGSGGEYSHVLSSAEMPVHAHAMPQGSDVPSGTTGPVYASGDDGTRATKPNDIPNTGDAGGGQAHNNLPPYLTVYMWKRTA